MKNFLSAGLWIILWSPLLVVAQEKIQPIINSTLNGRIVDAKTRTALDGADVQIKGTTHQVLTDSRGSFSFRTGQKFPYILVITHVGYEPLEYTANESVVEIGLKNSPLLFNEVVVVGYGTQKRTDVVGSITKIDAGKVNKLPVASFDAQLQGQASGVQVNNNAGIPGEAVFMRVRGTTSINSSNDPLYIVDGVFINNSSLQTLNTGGRKTSPLVDINPSDIESIEVLKDASATSIYGARGANGVVIITTKRGDYNVKPKVNLNVSQGQAWATRIWKLADGPATAQAVNDNYVNTQTDRGIAYDVAYAARPFRPVADGGKGNPEDQKTYDRLGLLFRHAKLQEYDLSVQGGSNATKYYLAAGYTDQEGVIKPVHFQRGSLKLNLDQRVNDRITLGISNSLSRSFRNQVPLGDGTTNGPILSAPALGQATYDPLYNSDGTIYLTGTNRDNVLILLQDADMKTVSSRYLGNFYADVQILKDLKFRSSWSIDYNLYDEKAFFSSRVLAGAGGGSANSALTQNTTWLNEQTLTYRKKLGNKHTIGALVGNSIQSNVVKFTAATGTGFPNDTYKIIAAASTYTANESWTKYNLASFFSRVDYNYAGKYFLEGSLRADGSSRFGENKQWGYFPSVGAGWRIKKEKFLEDVDQISELKLKASYGITGNQNGISDFASRGLWSGGYNYADNEGGSSYGAGTGPRQLANPDLKWERTSQVNAGLELGLFRGNVNVELSVYRKYTTDALLQLPVAGLTGFSTYTTNAGEISNKGLELSINTTLLRNKDFSWSAGFNISRNINKVEKLAVPVTYYSRDWIRLQEGYPMYSFWLHKQLYVDQKTGNSVYEDVNGDGSITVADRRILGSAMPDFFGGLSTNLRYRNIDLAVIFTYQWGNEIWNHNRLLSMYGGTRVGRSLHAADAGYWKQPGDITDFPRFTSEGQNWALEQNSRLMEDASFLRLKSLSIGYTVPESIAGKAHIKNLRVYFAGTNLWLLTNYSGPDPESNVSNASQMIQGVDFGTPPQPVSLQFGINLTL